MNTAKEQSNTNEADTQLPTQSPLPLVTELHPDLAAKWGNVSVNVLGTNDEAKIELYQNTQTGAKALVASGKVIYEDHYRFLDLHAFALPVRTNQINAQFGEKWGDVAVKNIGWDTDFNDVWENSATKARAILVKTRHNGTSQVIFDDTPEFEAAEPDIRLYGVSYPIGGKTLKWEPRR